MALTKSAVRFFIMISTIYIASVSALEFEVIDSSGRTIDTAEVRHYNVTVGQSIEFIYDNRSHNLLQVTQQNLESCNVTSLIKKYTSGDDIISFHEVGHFYYVCGFPDHCKSGERFDIEVIQKLGQSFNISTQIYPFSVRSRGKIGYKDAHLYHLH